VSITMLRSPRIIKIVHTGFFIAWNALLLVLVYEVIADRITAISFLALGVFFVEGIILAVNGWSCPLTEYAERLGSSSGRVTDIFLPGWMADRAFEIYGVLVASVIVLFVLRLLV